MSFCARATLLCFEAETRGIIAIVPNHLDLPRWLFAEAGHRSISLARSDLAPLTEQSQSELEAKQEPCLGNGA